MQFSPRARVSFLVFFHCPFAFFVHSPDFVPDLCDCPCLIPSMPNRRQPVTRKMKTSVPIVRGIESLFGTRDENIRLLESGLKVSTQLINDSLEIEGEPANVARAENILQDYVALVREGHIFNNGDLNSYLRVCTEDPEVSLRALVSSGRQRTFGKKVLAP